MVARSVLARAQHGEDRRKGLGSGQAPEDLSPSVDGTFGRGGGSGTCPGTWHMQLGYVRVNTIFTTEVHAEGAWGLLCSDTDNLMPDGGFEENTDGGAEPHKR